jgi:hypothetical protein
MTGCATRVGGHVVDGGRTHVPPACVSPQVLPTTLQFRLASARGRNGLRDSYHQSDEARRFGVRISEEVALRGGRLP